MCYCRLVKVSNVFSSEIAPVIILVIPADMF